MLNIVLYQPEIPQNTGNIGRTCVALGAKLWLIRPLGFRVDDHNMKRAGLDYWEHLQLEICDCWEDFYNVPKETPLYFYTKFATRLYNDVHYSGDEYLVFGSETRGLPKGITEPHSANCLRFPTTEKVRSLNLSNAVAIGAYEAMRCSAGSKPEFGLGG